MLKIIMLVALAAIAVGTPGRAKLKEAAIRLPDDLGQVERLGVKGRQGWRKLQTVTFGDYRAHDVQRSLSKGSSLQILAYEGAKARQTFGFSLAADGTTRWRGEAETTVRRRALDVGIEIELKNRSGFAARLAPVERPDDRWILKLEESRERPLQGTLSRGQRSLAVRGTNRLAGTPLPLDLATGYVFETDGRAVAAVEVINDGAVWLSPGLPPEFLEPVAAAIASLLLFEELRQTLPD